LRGPQTRSPGPLLLTEFTTWARLTKFGSRDPRPAPSSKLSRRLGRPQVPFFRLARGSE
jgi:hypothetical protein